MYKWTVTYGPFSDEMVFENAKALGWKGEKDDRKPEDVITESLKYFMTHRLSLVKVRLLSKQIDEQANAVKKAVFDEVYNLITPEVEKIEEVVK